MSGGSRAERCGRCAGSDPLTAWYESTNVLNLMRAKTASQWKLVSREGDVSVAEDVEYQVNRSVLDQL